MYGSKHRTADGSYENRKETTTNSHSSNKREWSEESSNHRKYIRTQSSSSNRSSQQRQNGEKEKKTTKEPLRVVGDWSEFRSSTGKIYFYNCKTEVSQWEKPKGWPSDGPSSRSKKESSSVPDNSSRSSVKPSLSHSKSSISSSQHVPLSNGTSDVPVETNARLTSPVDESSRMSISSSNSLESSSQVPAQNGTRESIADPPSSTSNGRTESLEMEVAKAEREQDIQRYYRADLIQHLTDWSSSQLEKQCFKLFDDYYGYSAKMSSTLVELKALKSNYRVLEIRRNLLTQKRLRCEQHLKERENDAFS